MSYKDAFRPNHARHAHQTTTIPQRQPQGGHQVRPLHLSDTPHLASITHNGRPWRDSRVERDRAQTILHKNTAPARRSGQKIASRDLPTFHQSSGTTCPKSGSLLAHYENLTGGTTLNQPRSPQHLQCTQRILPGLQDTVVQIFAIFEGYDYTEFNLIID